jgi:predicted lipoprotein with Yx(FWY)xxD motif
MRRQHLGLTLVALTTALVTAACGGEESPGGTETGTETGGGGDAMSDVVLLTTDSDLGEIVVDGESMTVYYFANDEPDSGESACDAACLAMWPPVHAGSEDPQVEGVTAEVGTITGTDGELQVTLEGRPVYLYAGDSAPGDVTGQGVNDVWWVVAPDGAEITETSQPGLGDDGGSY